MINIYSSSRYKINKKELKKYTQDYLNANTRFGSSVINIAFVGKRKMKETANTYKQENVALPVLAFSYMDDAVREDNLAGEIMICYPQAVLLAAERDKPVEAMMKQLLEHALKQIFKINLGRT